MPEPAAEPGASAPAANVPGASGPGASAPGPGAAGGAPSCVAETTRYLERITELNPALGAVITVSPDALEQAAARDQQQPRSGPLHGVPVLIKDNIDVRGLPATAGSPALGDTGDRGDAFLVTRLRAAGAVILGKANLSEWAKFRSYRSTSGWSTLGGQAANPHALDRNPSGSSSGSGVAVAAGLAPLAVGTETDGPYWIPNGDSEQRFPIAHGRSASQLLVRKASHAMASPALTRRPLTRDQRLGEGGETRTSFERRLESELNSGMGD